MVFTRLKRAAENKRDGGAGGGGGGNVGKDEGLVEGAEKPGGKHKDLMVF